MLKIQPIILAAGRGSRIAEYTKTTYGQAIPKVMLTLDNRPLLDYIVSTIEKAGFPKPVVVVGYKKEQIIKYFGDRIKYIEQKEPLGTGHAVLVCEKELRGKSDNFLVCYGDMPFWSIDTLNKIKRVQSQSENVLTIGSINFEKPNFWCYGRIIRDSAGKILATIEQKDASSAQKKIKECWPGILAASDSWMWAALKEIKSDNLQKEYYLPTLVEIAVSENRSIATAEIKEEFETIGVNTVEQYKLAKRTLEIYQETDDLFHSRNHY